MAPQMLAEQEAELERMKSQNTLEESSQRRGLLAELAAEQERTLGKLEAVRAKSGEAGATFDVLADLAARLAARVTPPTPFNTHTHTHPPPSPPGLLSFTPRHAVA